MTHGPIETDVSNLETETLRAHATDGDTTITRIFRLYVHTHAHPMHVISTAIPPDPLDTWPENQDVNDINQR